MAKSYAGTESVVKDRSLVSAYARGREASVAGSLITTNPHTSGTPEWEHWRRGHVMYAAGGTNTVPDGCAQPAKFVNPLVVATVTSTDPTERSRDFGIPAPGLPCKFDFGDGVSVENLAGNTSPIVHRYPNATADYTFRLILLGKVWQTITISIVPV